MWDHASDGLVEDATGCTEMEGTTSSGIVTSDLSEVGMVLDCEGTVLVLRLDFTPREYLGLCDRRTFSTEEFARDVEGFGPNDNNLLTIEKLLCDGTGETTEQVSLAVNDNLELSRRCQFPVQSSIDKVSMRLQCGQDTTYDRLERRHLAPESPANFKDRKFASTRGYGI